MTQFQPYVAPYGSWASPISAEMIASAGIGLVRAWSLPNGGTAWLEGRPTEGGRIVLVRRDPGEEPRDVTPAESNVRTRVHEYGGGACLLLDDTVIYSNFADQRLYRLDTVTGEAGPITPEPDQPAAHRYADPTYTADDSTLIYVRERQPESDEAINELVALPVDGSAEPRIIAGGADFYATPRVSPDGSQLAWLSWTHPRMPWDGTELWVADLEDGELANTMLVAGGPEESIVQPSWSPDGVLHFISDRTGWWNLYALRDGETVPLAPMDAECGVPLWTFDLGTYAFLDDGRILCVVRTRGEAHLALIDSAAGTVEFVHTRYTTYSAPSIHGTRAVFIAASPTEAPAVIALDLLTREIEIVQHSMQIALDPRFLSIPEAIEFPTTDGVTAHALSYPPQSRDYRAADEERPPLIVMSHGGPTSATDSTLNLRTQFWTSRGFAVVDVNYRGSTGYGREYRQALNHRWGEVDVDDCVEAARFLALRGDVDGARMAIRGGSAGGYTTLAALTFRDVFAGGASYYGIGDLETLVGDTHKFESRYPDSLVGPYPEARDVYLARSPAHHTDQLSCPIIMFQGLEDRIVPPSQSEQMAASLRAKGIPYAYVPFEGEQHGFRRAENIQRAHEAELWFYGWLFGFEPADEVAPVEMVGL